MSLTALLRLVRSRGWLVGLVAVAGAAAGFGYSMHQQPQYQATVAFYVHPATAVVDNHQAPDELDLLAHGVVLPTLADAAESFTTLHAILPAAGLTQASPADYQITATAHTEARVVDVAVNGPSSASVSRVAAKLPATISQLADSQFLVSISTDNLGVSVTRALPRTARNTLAGAASGVLVGIVLAQLSMSPQLERQRRPRSRAAVQGPGE